MSYGSNRSLGVATLKGNFKGKILKNKTHLFGGQAILVVELIDCVFVVGNICGTDSRVSNISLFQEFEEEIAQITISFPQAKIILGGGWNTVQNPVLDCIPPCSARVNKFAEVENILYVPIKTVLISGDKETLVKQPLHGTVKI